VPLPLITYLEQLNLAIPVEIRIAPEAIDRSKLMEQMESRRVVRYLREYAYNEISDYPPLNENLKIPLYMSSDIFKNLNYMRIFIKLMAPYVEDVYSYYAYCYMDHKSKSTVELIRNMDGIMNQDRDDKIELSLYEFAETAARNKGPVYQS
jgi:hypothetical protein